MRTTLDLPKELIQEGMKVSEQKTKTALIIEALEDLIRKKKIQKLRDYKGKVQLNIDLNILRDR
jgi:hypothetical protein